MNSNTAKQLEYGQRFGAGIRDIVKTHTLSVAASNTEEMAASARYTRWFRGEEQGEPTASSKRKYRRITSDMPMEEIAQATRDNLTILGTDTFQLIQPRLPQNHRMAKSIRSMILPSAPYLGNCKFGEVLSDSGPDTIASLQFFISNFDATLDTEGMDAFLRPKSKNFDQVFYGVHVITDRNGNMLDFDRRRGASGVAFKTKNLSEALCAVASTSTGLPINELLARSRRK